MTTQANVKERVITRPPQTRTIIRRGDSRTVQRPAAVRTIVRDEDVDQK